ncbi:hypothetical protein TIFTF001_040520 [Ficus carica]|uniref:N-acetyl-gamma-glutamyl-phosphate reductase dimerisation domain-containing protein n=1 Tax=Ficus carica TaxID=3494 RepID=A0AA88CN01_FICCA|nr:hypothetical protein TIFTF001_040520 [Ficus carica]
MQEIIKGLPKSLKIVDLSADFRLRDTSEYEEWYGQEHRASDLQKEVVYGLTEILREEIKDARLVANPGCYPTSIQLPLVPLIKANLIEFRNIIIDSKSGVSGAGRGAKEANLYTEISEGIYSYGVTRHRHGVIGCSTFKDNRQFYPTLDANGESRGMQSTIYVEMASGVTTEDLYQQLKKAYEACVSAERGHSGIKVACYFPGQAPYHFNHPRRLTLRTSLTKERDEEFVILLEKGVVPHTHNVRGSNYCIMNIFPDRIPGRAIIVSVIDNLVKGASGQALQNLNLMLGFPESTGLLYQPLFP